jgi:hypothetical protein
LPAPDDADRGGTFRRDLRRGIVLAAFAASAAVFIVVDSGSHSGSDTLYAMVVPMLAIVGASLAAWLAVGAATGVGR